MSPSMLLGRVILPVTGLTLAIVLVWQYARTGSIELPEVARLSGPILGRADRAETLAPAPPEVLPLPATPPTIVAEGRVVAYPGAEVVVGAEAPGTIVRVLVQEKSPVRKGDLLVEFRADDLRASLEEALARVAESEAELTYQQSELLRTERLLKRQAGSDEEHERFSSRLSVAAARRAAAIAIVRRLEAAISKTRVVSPIDGIVVARHVHPGETVNVGASLVKVVDLRKTRIEAEVDEYDVGRCALRSPVSITAEGYRGKSWQGTVEEVADIVTGRRLRPEDPGRPTDTRVLPVRIAFREPTPLKLGQRVEVTISEAGHEAAPQRSASRSSPPTREGRDEASTRR
jgi:RND family efflux transporter MFP subunit